MTILHAFTFTFTFTFPHIIPHLSQLNAKIEGSVDQLLPSKATRSPMVLKKDPASSFLLRV